MLKKLLVIPAAFLFTLVLISPASAKHHWSVVIGGYPGVYSCPVDPYAYPYALPAYCYDYYGYPYTGVYPYFGWGGGGFYGGHGFHGHEFHEFHGGHEGGFHGGGGHGHGGGHR